MSLCICSWKLSSLLEKLTLLSFVAFPVFVEPFSGVGDGVISPQTNYIFSPIECVPPNIHVIG